MEEALMISIKNGDIKCDVGEVRFLLYIVEQMNQLINKYAVGEDKTEREKIKKFIEYYEYFKDKYLVLQEIRNQENFYFNQMKAWQKKLNESSDENMKKLILMAAVALMALPAAAQMQEAFPSYIQVNGRAEKEITPDEFYLSIVINERDSKGKISVESQQRDMIAAL